MEREKRFNKEVAEILKQYKENNNLSLVNLEKTIGLTISAISKQLSGQRTISIGQVKTYADAFGVDVAQLLPLSDRDPLLYKLIDKSCNAIPEAQEAALQILEVYENKFSNK